MSVWGRFMRASQAFISAWNEKAFLPDTRSGWDLYANRQLRYYYADLYYNNVVYSALSQYAAVHKFNNKLYKYIRGIYNPVQRLVETYVSKVYGGALDMKNLKVGAIPVADADDNLREALRQLWKWSNWGGAKSLYVRYGAMYGDVPIKVVDDPSSGKVRLEVLHPGKIKDIQLSPVGDVKRVVIEYQRDEETLRNPTGGFRQMKTYTYTEVIDEDSFSTYRDGEPYAYYADENGRMVAAWENRYGFVPMVLAKHKDRGFVFGENAFNGATRKIDEINDAASILNDQARKVVNAMFYFAGVRAAAELTASGEQDELPAIYGPKESSATPMVANIDIAAVSQNIQNMLLELERDQPELALHRVREGGNLTAPGINAGWSDAVERIQEARAITTLLLSAPNRWH
jgi:hypothetical protein